MTTEDLEVISRRADSLIEDHAALLTRLIALRKEHGLSQAEVARRMGVSQPTVAGFERYDANPTLSTLRRYALAVGARLETHVVDDSVVRDREYGASVAGETFTTSAGAGAAPVIGSWVPTASRLSVNV